MTRDIHKTVTVPLTASEAFELFTDRIDLWWPKDSHSVLAEGGDGRDLSIHMDPRAGGRVTETRTDGATADWATVTAFEPGRRLSLEWYPGRDADAATRVDVDFTQTEAGTRVELTHSGFDVYGDTAETACAGYDSGWDHVLGGCYVSSCKRRAA